MKLSQVQISLIAFSLFQFAILQLQLETASGYGEFCYDKLDACKQNEVCIIDQNGTSGICRCLPGYKEVSQNKTCVSSDIPSDVPSSGNTGLTVALVFLVIIVSMVGSIGFLYYRYGFFSGAIHSLYRFRRRAPSEQAYQITDDGDDINPIV